MKWETDFSKLPKFDGERFAGKQYICTLLGVTNNKVVTMYWVKTRVRDNIVYRWEWNGRICKQCVMAFMDFPEAYEPLK